MANAHTNHSGESHGSLSSYLTGFILSVILTAAAFLLVEAGVLSTAETMAGVAVLAVVQILVHLYFFLHMNASSEQRWNVMAFVFTVVILGIVVTGTLWVMHNANMMMMPQ